MFEDDKQVKMRIAGSFDLTVLDLNILDLSGLPGEIVTKLLDALETEDHVLYVECSNFSMKLLRLNWERNGN